MDDNLFSISTKNAQIIEKILGIESWSVLGYNSKMGSLEKSRGSQLFKAKDFSATPCITFTYVIE